MLETMMASTTFVKCGVQDNLRDPLRWDCQQFPTDSNCTFSPIKQEVMDTYENQGQSDFTELKAMPFDYGASLTGVDPCLSNNDSNNNHSGEKANNQHLNIYIKPLSPPTPSSRESFCFNASPSDVTSSGSISPPGIIKIDFPSTQDAFDDIANIVGISCGMGADSTVPGHDTLENLDLDAWIENTANIVKPLGHDGYESILPTSSGPENCITNVSMSNTQPYLSPLPGSALANLLTQASLKGPRVTSLEQRDPFPTNLSPILRNQLTGYQGYPQIKLEAGYEMMKQEYPQYDQLPHSTMGGDPRHRLGIDCNGGRSKQKPPKPRPVSDQS
jgi:hypothetical protein